MKNWDQANHMLINFFLYSGCRKRQIDKVLAKWTYLYRNQTAVVNSGTADSSKAP